MKLDHSYFSLPPVPQAVRHRVSHVLAELEAERDLRVLYACESGSRAWGFASHDSDYDVRFLYVHRRDWYLSVENYRDVVELPLDDELDVSGWELRKALRLLRKSNPPLLEWLSSPLVYREDEAFTREFRALAASFYSPSRCFSHYLHMAFGNWRAYLLDKDTVGLKKYLYVFRPVLACRWLERSLGAVPMLFETLVNTVLEEPNVRDSLQELVASKKSGVELLTTSPVQVLHDFLSDELARLDALQSPPEVTSSVACLDQFLRKHVLP